MIDPTLCRADRMVGQVLGSVGALPDIYVEIEISYYLLRRLLGVRTEGDKKGAKVLSQTINSQDPLFHSKTLWTIFFCVIPGSETIQRRSIDGQHWVLVYWWKSNCSQGWFGQSDTDQSCLYGSRWENCIEQESWETLEVRCGRRCWEPFLHGIHTFTHHFQIDWMGSNSSWGDHSTPWWSEVSLIFSTFIINFTKNWKYKNGSFLILVN